MDTLTAVRRVRLVTPALLIMGSLLATGCGAGQVTQTATQVITQEGANAERGGIAVRGVRIATPPRGEYKTGEEAPLYLAISAEEGVSDRLVSVTSDAATGVVYVESPLDPSAAPSSPSPTSSSPSSPSPAGSPSATPASTPSASPSETPSASPSAPVTGLEIGTGALIVLTEGMSYLELRGLLRDLAPGDTVSVTFSFARAGDITLEVPVATPDTPGPRLKPTEGAEHE